MLANLCSGFHSEAISICVAIPNPEHDVIFDDFWVCNHTVDGRNLQIYQC